MVKAFLIERSSWIMLFVSLQLLLLLISYLDASIALTSMTYVVFLSTLIMTVFFIIRYRIETAFYRKLRDRENDLELWSLPEANSPFEKVVEQTIALEIEKLQEAISKKQIAIEQEKDDLLSWIHEVKTPLTVMSLMIERLEDKEAKAELTYEWLRIHLLLDQQLHSKRISFIQSDVYIERVDLESTLFGEIKTLRSWCIRKGIGFEIDLEVEEVLSDAKWLAFIMRQLLTNAVKYSNSSDLSITSSISGNQTVLRIRDYGQGIDSQDLPRIFDKGFTSTTRHSDHAATGMGLYLARKVAEALHITLEVQSESGVGTTVTVIFPSANEFESTRGV
ncbi:sensor histidine kinase [Guptibacillus algicola]|uniref:sensor histidine kinase n=1 Tax=Guptibacillus algicola TaxID=225844 RepID=UPI001CD619D4|nr:sensor histidine kinase [Alkalihalobacillus algicola]MCA0987541.1 sensor histidine kinase [Alkalihalobacillus algicola]